MPRFEVITPRATRPLIDQLRGQRAGYGDAYRQLERDPCAEHLGAYRLSGPLVPVVCGVHLKNEWRLAFTMQPPEQSGGPTRVVVLYVGRREPRHNQSDAWTILHDLFGVESPSEGHLKPPCCQDDFPDVSDEQLDAFLRELAKATRKHGKARVAGRRRRWKR